MWFPFTLLQIHQNVDQTGYADCRTLALPFFFSSCVGGQPLEQRLECDLHLREACTYQSLCHPPAKPQPSSVFMHTIYDVSVTWGPMSDACKKHGCCRNNFDMLHQGFLKSDMLCRCHHWNWSHAVGYDMSPVCKAVCSQFSKLAPFYWICRHHLFFAVNVPVDIQTIIIGLLWQRRKLLSPSDVINISYYVVFLHKNYWKALKNGWKRIYFFWLIKKKFWIFAQTSLCSAHHAALPQADRWESSMYIEIAL